jgi:hypothetical protein
MKKLIIAIAAVSIAAVIFRKKSVAKQLRLIEGKIDQLRARIPLPS